MSNQNRKVYIVYIAGSGIDSIVEGETYARKAQKELASECGVPVALLECSDWQHADAIEDYVNEHLCSLPTARAAVNRRNQAD